mmetsp:Transcript_57434/g.121876  ORF Transcript_57434/g.121876 Transcript_57434/m.121876 type:complete len:262 (-) Transcript_57434:1907-2692(-)
MISSLSRVRAGMTSGAGAASAVAGAPALLESLSASFSVLGTRNDSVPLPFLYMIETWWKRSRMPSCMSLAPPRTSSGGYTPPGPFPNNVLWRLLFFTLRPMLVMELMRLYSSVINPKNSGEKATLSAINSWIREKRGRYSGGRAVAARAHSSPLARAGRARFPSSGVTSLASPSLTGEPPGEPSSSSLSPSATPEMASAAALAAAAASASLASSATLSTSAATAFAASSLRRISSMTRRALSSLASTMSLSLVATGWLVTL